MEIKQLAPSDEEIAEAVVSIEDSVYRCVTNDGCDSFTVPVGGTSITFALVDTDIDDDEAKRRAAYAFEMLDGDDARRVIHETIERLRGEIACDLLLDEIRNASTPSEPIAVHGEVG